jgi:ADP-dependent NAD(P)H-hydrate dehydratase / NAD(P)H-hydrate epimerase
VKRSDALLVPLPTAAEMRDWEKRCFAPGRMSERVVLESAGRAAALAIARHFPAGRVVAGVGAGNNGGDALVALRTLRAWGRDVLAVPVRGDAIREDLLHGWEIPTSSEPARAFREAGVIVDGILGTGASGAPRADQADLVRSINASGVPVVALDGPTGVDMSTGAVPGEAIRAALTVTFGAIKRGLVLHPGRQYAGRILLAEVGFPPASDGTWGAELVTDAWAAENLPAIAPSAHKTEAGIVAVVAGRTGMGGAAIMSAMGALRAGCGGVRVVSTESNRSAVHAALPEAVFFERGQDWGEEALKGVRAVLLGPGMGTDDSARGALEGVLASFSGPLLLDADALTLLAREPGLLPDEVGERVLLTPHPGELARLLGVSVDEVLEDRFEAAAEASRRFGCAVLAKGAPSIVARADRPTLVSVAGHSGIATGGMGDTLGGIAAAAMAAGAEPRTAGALALQLSGRAAEIAGRGRGLLPRDVAEAVPEAILRLGGHPPAEPMFPIDLPAPA